VFNEVSDSGLESEEAKEFLEKGQKEICDTIEKIMKDR